MHGCVVDMLVGPSASRNTIEQYICRADLVTSALAEYVHFTGHRINWTEACVIDTFSHASRLCLLESWMIHRETNHLNRELASLPHIYKTLIRHS